jgi:DNA polymerase-3 subunit gamma/tau
MLLKGVAEVEAAGRPLAAAEMVLVRMAYAADLPTPDEVIRSLGGNGEGGRPQGNGGGVAAGPGPGATARHDAGARAPAPRPGAIPPRGSPQAAIAPAVAAAGDPAARPPEPRVAEPSLVIDRFEDLIALAAQRRDVGVKVALERDVRLVSCEDGRLEITLEKSAAKTLVNDLARKFSQWTNRRWMVVVSAEQGQPTVKAQNDARQAELEIGVRADPLVQAVLARFPGAEIISVREAEQPAVLPTGEPDEVMPEPPPVDDVFAYGAPERFDDEDR